MGSTSRLCQHVHGTGLFYQYCVPIKVLNSGFNSEFCNSFKAYQTKCRAFSLCTSGIRNYTELSWKNTPITSVSQKCNKATSPWCRYPLLKQHQPKSTHGSDWRYKEFCTNKSRLRSGFMSSRDKMKSEEVQSIQHDMRTIFNSAVAAVYPPQMVHNAISLSHDSNTLTIANKSYRLDNNVYVVGFGKAVSGMARALEDLIGQHIVEGVISIPHGTKELFMSIGKEDLYITSESKIRVFEGARDNLPDADAHAAAKAIQALATKLGKADVLIVLISGGGSALLPSPVPPVSLEDELALTKMVARAGGSIQDLNTLRQNIEVLKGGGLSMLAKPAQVISLILSDVIEDKLDIISSGPTTPLLTSPRQCLQILDRLNVNDKAPGSVLEILQAKASEKKTLQESSPYSHNVQAYESQWSHVQNVIIGSNTIATNAAFDQACNLGYVPVILTNSLQGEAGKAAELFVKLSKFIMLAFTSHGSDQSNVALSTVEVDLINIGLTKIKLKCIESAITQAQNSQTSLCLICGGETTVHVTGNGKGGRNQEMALGFVAKINEMLSSDSTNQFSNFHIEFLSAGTDGQDGPTDVAGAIVNKYVLSAALSAKADPGSYLKNNDSYTLFKAINDGDNFIQPGLTGTNVMDVQILVVKPLN